MRGKNVRLPDGRIMDLIESRDEGAIGALDTAYGGLITTICRDILRDRLSMITVVGENASDDDNMTVRLLLAAAEEGVSISTINQGAGRLNLILGVNECDYERTIRALYREIRKSGKPR